MVAMWPPFVCTEYCGDGSCVANFWKRADMLVLISRTCNFHFYFDKPNTLILIVVCISYAMCFTILQTHGTHKVYTGGSANFDSGWINTLEDPI